jgi:glutamyl-Q tRNA(Asp) synthetase
MAAGSLICKIMPADISPSDHLIRGRFAPSPTGDLHFGSLVAAVGSFLQARARGGQWLVRIEDIDPPREVYGAARSQIHTLKQFGMVPDEPVQYQRHFHARHLAALEQLLASGRAFDCGCSRRDLPESGIYPGTCRNGLRRNQTARSVRLRVSDEPVCFDDLIQGPCRQLPSEQTGDFVIRRADGLIAYQLAVVVDDAASGVTEVVRGADLIDSTARQILVYKALGLSLPQYAHLPLVIDEHGRKLSKSQADDPVHHHAPATALRLALRALDHEPGSAARSLDALWQSALENWDIRRVPRGPVCIGVHPGQR